MTDRKSTFENIHLLRGLSIFFIVLTHVSLFYRPHGEDLSYDIYLAVLSEWTTVFLLISGFLFSHLAHRFHYPRFLRSKALNVALPYLILTLPAALIYALGVKTDHQWVDVAALREHNILYQFAYLYGTGAHLGPMWYIPTILLIFLAAPLAHALAKNQNRLFGLVPVFLLWIFFTERPDNNSHPLLAAVHFFPVFLLGMAFHKLFTHSSASLKRAVVMGSSFLFVSMFAYSVTAGGSSYVLQKIFAFPLLMHLLSLIKVARVKQALGRMADFSFSIYFLHGYAAFVVKSVNPYVTDNLGVNVVTAVLLSLVVTYVIIAVIFIASRALGKFSRPILAYGMKP